MPRNQSSATGAAVVTLAGDALSYSVTTSAFDSPVMFAHLQIGAANTIGPVVAGLKLAAQSGQIATGSADLSGYVTFNTLSITGDSLRTLLDRGYIYVNIRTSAYPDGEIRGQLLRQ